MRTGRYYLFPPTCVSFCQKITHPVRLSLSDLGRVKPEARYAIKGPDARRRPLAHVRDQKFNKCKKNVSAFASWPFYPVKTLTTFNFTAQQRHLNRPPKASELRHDCSADKTESVVVRGPSQASCSSLASTKKILKILKLFAC